MSGQADLLPPSFMAPSVVKDSDVYYTPPRLTRAYLRFLRELGLLPPPGSWVVEPSAGAGHIVGVLTEPEFGLRAIAVEPDGSKIENLFSAGALGVHEGTWEEYLLCLNMPPDAMVFANPPGSLAAKHARLALDAGAKWVSMLTVDSFCVRKSASEMPTPSAIRVGRFPFLDPRTGQEYRNEKGSIQTGQADWSFHLWVEGRAPTHHVLRDWRTKGAAG